MLDVLFVRVLGLDPGVGLDDDLHPGFHELPKRVRRQRDSPLALERFFRDAERERFVRDARGGLRRGLRDRAEGDAPGRFTLE